MPLPYIETMRCLYEGQIGTIVGRREKALAQVEDRWVEKGWGIKAGPCTDDRLLNLCLADDLLLVSRSLKVLKKIMVELRRAVGEVGLELHVGKTTILSNAQGRKQSHATSVDLEEQRY